MPAVNMGTSTTVPANPATGKFVMMDPLSGPKGSPKDKDQSGNYSTGALCTGIGCGATHLAAAEAVMLGLVRHLRVLP